MTREQPPALMTLCCIVGTAALLYFLFLDLPLLTGMSIADGPDPDRPDRLKAIMPSPLALLVEFLLVVGGFTFAWRLRPRYDS